MIPFEIHITEPLADNRKQFYRLTKELGLKTILIDLLTPKKDRLRSERMTSIVQKFESYDDCLSYVDQLLSHFISHDCLPRRIKIETPWRDNFADRAQYIEAHFPADSAFAYPVSRNFGKSEMLATTRIYDQAHFKTFKDFWGCRSQVELCLYDNYSAEDHDWFMLWKDQRYNPVNGTVYTLIDAARIKLEEDLRQEAFVEAEKERNALRLAAAASDRTKDILELLGILPSHITVTVSEEGNLQFYNKQISAYIGEGSFEGDRESFWYRSANARTTYTPDVFDFIKGLIECL